MTVDQRRFLKLGIFHYIVFLFIVLFSVYDTNAQQADQQLGLARQYVQQKEFSKATPIFKMLYDRAPFDKGIYDEYLAALIDANDYEAAVALAEYMMKIRREDPVILLDLGNVYELSGKSKKAEEQYELALQKVSGEDMRTRQLADAFVRLNKIDYAVKVYERARVMMQHAYLYGAELALLYAREGKTKEAVNAMMDVLITQPNALEGTKTSLLQLVEGDPKKLTLVQKELARRIATQPQNPYWNELLTWTHIQRGDYEGAFKEITSLDKKLDEQGERVLGFAASAVMDGKFDMALRSYEYVMAKGNAAPFYEQAWEGKVKVMLAQLDARRPVDQVMVKKLSLEYKEFFADFPHYMVTSMMRDYARVLARYANQVDTAIVLLETVIKAPNAKHDFTGQCKLDLGDYYLLKGLVWEATLTYAQVDKAFKQDLLGEEARFRNARLSYYRGDFKWAQEQLSVLKASTTELIANDALYLSVLITENSPPDSNMVPLERFVAADLLLFQYKTEAADLLLDSISRVFPETPLQDDILMLRAKIALENRVEKNAVTYLQKILDDYGDDVLGDDAAYRMALLYRDRIKDQTKALQYFELLITRYPGSTYIQSARAEYQLLLKGQKPDPNS